MWFKYFLIYGFPTETLDDHRQTEQIVRETRPDSVCLSLLQPIPGTEVYEELKPHLLQDVSEIEFHYWHATESYKHPIFTHQQLHEERERLLKIHAREIGKLTARLHRKWERLCAMVKNPVLIGDWFEVRRRRTAYRQRVRRGAWRHALDRASRDDVARQVPRVLAD
jgi:radical SAM superfamily enzyme YgiQ (UPF0313 family)